MVKVLIIGSGVVGQAVGKGLVRFGVDVTFYDLDRRVLRGLKEEEYRVSNTILQSDFYYICVPEKYVIDVVFTLREKKGIIIVKSTVPVGTTRYFASCNIRNICHNPEFLREATSEEDFINANMLVLGSPLSRNDAVLMEVYNSLYWWYPYSKTVFTTSNVSEMVKLALNGYLSATIGYWNEIYRLCRIEDVNSHEVGVICSRDPRVTTYGSTRHGKPYGGRCLIKDMDQLIDLAERQGLKHTLFHKIKERNV